MKSKTIILSKENEKGRGILTLYEEDGLLQCRIRLYNIEKLNRFCKLGIYHEKQVYSANLLEKNGVYTSSMVGDFDIDQDFYSAIIDTQDSNNVILSGGTYAGFFFNDNAVFDEKVSNNNIFNNVKKENPNTNLYDYTEQEPQLISSVIMENENSCLENSNTSTPNECDKCEKCKYKEFFYSQNNQKCEEQAIDQTEAQPLDCEKEETNNIQNSNSIEKPQNTDQKTIAESLIPQFKYVFENYPHDEILNALIPNSKFVKIEENNNAYSIGAIYQEDEMKYICYAVLCDYNSPIPTEIGEHYQWLPIDKEDPLSEGYYIVFQDTQDLKIVEL